MDVKMCRSLVIGLELFLCLSHAHYTACNVPIPVDYVRQGQYSHPGCVTTLPTIIINVEDNKSEQGKQTEVTAIVRRKRPLGLLQSILHLPGKLSDTILDGDLRI